MRPFIVYFLLILLLCFGVFLFASGIILLISEWPYLSADWKSVKKIGFVVLMIAAGPAISFWYLKLLKRYRKYLDKEKSTQDLLDAD